MKKHLRVATNKLGEKGLFAKKNFRKKETVFKLAGKIMRHPTKYSIEVGHNEHIVDDKGNYFNHSCDPNTQIERKGRKVRARRDISAGEELTFDYNANETLLANPFQCKCGAENCQGYISGQKRKN